MSGKVRYCFPFLAYWRTSIAFSTFKDSLFAMHQSLMLTSSFFTTGKRRLMSLWLNKRFVSSANMIGPNKQDAFGRTFTYTRNRIGSGINPWEPQQVIYFRSVLLFLLIWIYCFLWDKRLSNQFKIFISYAINSQFFQYKGMMKYIKRL